MTHKTKQYISCVNSADFAKWCFCSHPQIQHVVQCSVLSLQHWDFTQQDGQQDRRQQTAATQGKTFAGQLFTRIHRQLILYWKKQQNDYCQCTTFIQNNSFMWEKHSEITLACLNCEQNCMSSLFVLCIVVEVEWTSALILQYSEMHRFWLQARSIQRSTENENEFTVSRFSAVDFTFK